MCIRDRNNIYCKEKWPFKMEESPSIKDINGLEYLSHVPFNFIESKIGLLIGMNQSKLLKPIEVVEGHYNSPFAVKYLFGWALQGSTPDGIPAFMSLRCHKTQIQQEDDNLLEKYCSREFSEKNPEQVCESVEDLKWKNKVENTLQRTITGKFQVGLPFKKENQHFPNNKNQALARLFSLKSKFLKDQEYFVQYSDSINEMLKLNFAEKVEQHELLNNDRFYLTHHSVIHQQKKKMRVVFNL